MQLPRLGVGLTWHHQQHQEILNHLGEIGWVEVITEQFVSVPDRIPMIKDLSRQRPVCTHGVSLSIGTPGPLKERLVQGTAALVQELGSPWYSEHLCYTEVPGFDLGQLTPVPFNEEQIEVVLGHVQELRRHLQTPFLLENISYYFTAPGATMSEAEFLTQVLERADVGLLLDVTNLYTNSQNHRFDPYEFLQQIPRERIIELHIAGGEHHGELLLDTHSQPVAKEVWDLVDYVCQVAPVKGIMLERDANLPPFQELIDELQIARDILQRHAGIHT